MRGVGKRTVGGGGPKPLFGRGVIREVFQPPLFSTPMASSEKWRGRFWLSCLAPPPLQSSLRKSKYIRTFGDKIGESLGGSQAPPSFWNPGLPRKFPELPQKFFGDFPGSSLTVERNSNPEVPRKFPKFSRKFSRLSRRFPGLPWRSAPFSPDSQQLSLKHGI